MKKYRVWGTTKVGVAITLDAESEDDAIEKAREYWEAEVGGLTNYVGNGGADKIVGVYDENVSLDAGCGEVEFESAEEEDENA